MSLEPAPRFPTLSFRLQRVARRLLWPHPRLYYPFGILRKRGSVFNRDHQLFISGYPRSANTFAREAFRFTNPGVRLRSHKHIPAFILQSIRRRTPGMTLLRNPLDASSSWAIFQNEPLEESLAYWNDYYHVLFPVRAALFLVRFEDVTTNFGAVMKAFNARWRTDYAPFEHSHANVAKCYEVIDKMECDPNGKICHHRVRRPSEKRHGLKQTHLEKVGQSRFLQTELAQANELYQRLLPACVVLK